MSATELLQEIEALPETERRWLLDKLFCDSDRNPQDEEERNWSKFSAGQLLEQYAPADAVYDEDQRRVPYGFGDVLLVPLVFSDASGAKRRPVLVVADTADADLLVTPVTSHASRTLADTELKDWQEAGLRLPSTARMAKLATVAKIAVIRKLGHLSVRDTQQTREALRGFFERLLEGAS